MFKHFTQHHVLHLASQHAAAHQPSVDLPYPRPAWTANDHSDHPVVAEYVRQSYLQCENIWVVLGFHNFGIGVAPSGQVILVGLVNKLNSARPPSGVEGLKGDGHVERSQVSIHAAHLLLQLCAPCVVLVETGTLQVLAGKGYSLKV